MGYRLLAIRWRVSDEASRRLFSQSFRMCEHRFEMRATFWAEIEIGKKHSWRSIFLALVITSIAGTDYFGRNVTRPVWLVLFIL
jgi:hypothetical protein